MFIWRRNVKLNSKHNMYSYSETLNLKNRKLIKIKPTARCKTFKRLTFLQIEEAHGTVFTT